MYLTTLVALFIYFATVDVLESDPRRVKELILELHPSTFSLIM